MIWHVTCLLWLCSREYKPWGGDDCSFLFAYAAAPRGMHPHSVTMALVVAVAVVVTVQVLTGEEGGQSDLLARSNLEKRATKRRARPIGEKEGTCVESLLDGEGTEKIDKASGASDEW